MHSIKPSYNGASIPRWYHQQLPHHRLTNNSSNSSSTTTGRSRAVRVKAGEEAAASSTPTAPQAPSVIVTTRGPFTWGSCVATKPNIQQAVEAAASNIQTQWAKQQQQQQQQQKKKFEPDLALVFASCNYGPQLQDVVAAVRRAAPSVKHIFGCSAYGVSGSSSLGPSEVEGEPGVVLSLAQLPGVELSLMHTLRSGLPTEDASPEAWADLVGVSPVERLTQSPPPSAQHTTQEEEEGEQGSQGGTTSEQQQQQQQQPPPPADTSSSSSSSSSSGSADGVKQDPLSSSGWQLRGNKAVSSSSSTAAAASAGGSGDSSQPGVGVSFLVLCDPKFPQIRQLLAGLDFAFPEANKAGVVLSQGQANRRRLMFAWSAEGGVEAGSAAWKRKGQTRRQQQQAEAAAAAAAAGAAGAAVVPDSSPAPQQQQQQQVMPPPPLPQQQQQQQQQPPDSSSSSSKKGLFSSLFGSLLSGLSDEPTQQQQQQMGSVSGTAAAAAADVSPRAAGDSGGDSGGDDVGDEEGDDPASCGGCFMYGVAVLAMKGPVVLETLTCQGYRTVSDKVWVVGDTSSDGDLILTLRDPDPDSSSDSDSDGEGEDDGSVSPLQGLYDLVESAWQNTDMEEVGDKVAVAIAPDSWSPITSLTPEQYTVSAISELWSDEGFIRIDGQARPGHRLRFVLRDEDGMRDDLRNRLLGLKRSELAAVMAGRNQPQPLAALLFSDISRGSLLYQVPHYESSVVASFLPVPLAGAFGAAQVSTVQGSGTLYEKTSVVGVLRVLPQPSSNGNSSSSSSESSLSSSSSSSSSSSTNKEGSRSESSNAGNSTSNQGGSGAAGS